MFVSLISLSTLGENQQRGKRGRTKTHPLACAGDEQREAVSEDSATKQLLGSLRPDGYNAEPVNESDRGIGIRREY